MSQVKNLYLPEARSILRLALPVIGSQLSFMAMSVADIIMAGQLSARDLAAVAVGSSFLMPIYVGIMGLLMAMNPIVSHLFGADASAEEIGGKLHQGLWLAFFVSIPAVFLLHQSGHFMAWMDIEKDTAALASSYLKAISYGAPFGFLFMAIRFFNDGLSMVKPTLIVLLFMIPVNIIGNYIFMYGKLGAPALGATGTGVGTAITLTCMCLCLGSWSLYHHGKKYHLLRWVAPHFADLKELLSIGVPNAVSICMEVTMFAMMAMYIGSIGQTEVGAHQIALNLASITFMVPMGTSIALGIRIGQAAGAGNYAAVNLSAKTGIFLIILIQAFTGSLMALFNNTLVGFYTKDVAVATLASTLLYYAAVFQISDGLQVTGMGILRGIKETRVPMFANTLAYWGIGMPAGYMLCFKYGWGPAGFWLAMVFGLSTAAALHIWRFRFVRKRFVSQLT